MKRLLSIMLVTVMLLTLVSVNVSATETTSEVIKGYAIRYPEGATDEVIHIATLVASVFEAWKWTGYDKNTRTSDATLSEKEILVGDCNRDEVQTAIRRTGVEKLGADGWVFDIVDNKVVVYGTTYESLKTAFVAMKENINSSTGVLTIPENHYSLGTDCMFDAENPISDYTIVANSNNLTVAQNLATAINSKFGSSLTVTTSDSATETDKEILIGDCGREETTEALEKLADDYPYAGSITQVGKKLVIVAKTNASLGDTLVWLRANYCTVSDVLSIPEDIDYNNSEYPDLIDYEKEKESDLRIMSFNVLGPEYSEKPPITGRDFAVATVLYKYRPDVVGLQEFSPSWYKSQRRHIADDYEFVSTFNDRNCSALAYNKKTVRCIETERVPYSVGSNTTTRIMTWGYFERLSDGKRFVAMSTHWGLNTQERLIHATELADKVNELHAKYECPVIVTGDYNANPSKEEYQLYVTKAAANDALYDAKEGYELSSAIFHIITIPPKPTATSVNSALDHITYTMGIGAKRAYAITGQTVVRASDHPPIMADFDFMPTFTIDNKQAVTPEKDSLSLRFSQNIDDNDAVKNKDNYTVSDEDGNKAEIVNVTAEGNILHFEFKDALKESVSYTITVSESVGFRASNGSLELPFKTATTYRILDGGSIGVKSKNVDASYPVSNVFDGDKETILKTTNSSGAYVIFDLGAEYPISKITMDLPIDSTCANAVYVTLSKTAPTSTNLSKEAEFKNYSGNVDASGNTVNYGSRLLNSSFDTSQNTKVNTAKTNMFNVNVKKPVTYTYKATTGSEPTGRYLVIYKPYSGYVALSELTFEVASKAYNEVYKNVNLARGKACFTVYESGHDDVLKSVYNNAVDGDATTYAIARTSGGNLKTQRFVVDLGESYVMDNIVLNPKNANTAKVYVTNSNDFATSRLTEVETFECTDNKPYTIDVSGLGGEAYRYVVVDRYDDTATSGGILLGIRELEVNKSMPGYEADIVSVPTTSYNISRGRTAYTTGVLGFGKLSAVTDGVYIQNSSSAQARVDAEAGKRHYLYVDLGDKYQIDYTIAMNHNGYSGLNQGYEVVGANSREDMESGKCDVLTMVEGFTKGGSSYAEPNIIKSNVVDKYKEKKYRYVGIRSSVNCALNVTEFEVFANGDDFVQALGNVKAEISGTSAVVSSTSATSAEGAGKYSLIVAGYDENDLFTGAKVSSITLSSKTALAAPFSVTVEDVVREDTAYVKAFILDDINTLRPVISYAIQSEVK